MKIAIVGAGASGLVLAWLLAKDHELFVFEKQDRIGGHAHTVYVPEINGKMTSVDIGFEFFNDLMFPHFNQLLRLLDVPIERYELTHTYYHSQNEDCLILPPLKNKKILWRILTFQNILRLLQFRYIISKAKKLIKDKDTSITLEQFVNGLSLTQSFKNSFFYPYLSGGWCVPIADFKTFSAFDVSSLGPTPTSAKVPLLINASIACTIFSFMAVVSMT